MRKHFLEGLIWELRLWDLYQVNAKNHKLMSFPLASKTDFGLKSLTKIKLYSHFIVNQAEINRDKE